MTTTTANFELGTADRDALLAYGELANRPNMLGTLIPFRAFGHDREGLVVGHHPSSGDPILAYRFPSIDHVELFRRLDAQADHRHGITLNRRLTTTELGTVKLFGLGCLFASDLLVRADLRLTEDLARATHSQDTLVELWEALDSVEADGTTYAKTTMRALYGRLFMRTNAAGNFTRPDDDDVIEVRRPSAEEVKVLGFTGDGYVTKGCTRFRIASLRRPDGGARVLKIGKALAKVRKALAGRVTEAAAYAIRQATNPRRPKARSEN